MRAALFFTMGAGYAVEELLAVPCALGAKAIVSWFRPDEAVVAVGAMALRAQMATLLPVTATIFANMLFQSLGLAGRAAFLSVLRSGLCFLPAILLLPPLFGIRGVAYAQPVADLFAFAISMPFLFTYLSSARQCAAPE